MKNDFTIICLLHGYIYSIFDPKELFGKMLFQTLFSYLYKEYVY